MFNVVRSCILLSSLTILSILDSWLFCIISTRRLCKCRTDPVMDINSLFCRYNSTKQKFLLRLPWNERSWKHENFFSLHYSIEIHNHIQYCIHSYFRDFIEMEISTGFNFAMATALGISAYITWTFHGFLISHLPSHCENCKNPSWNETDFTVFKFRL